jgi:hypothetical protein
MDERRKGFIVQYSGGLPKMVVKILAHVDVELNTFPANGL